MIDEKIEQINEQPGGPPAAPPPLTTRDKLRAAWARFQCSSLLRSHRIQTRTRLHAETLGALVCALPLAGQLGDWLYTLGFTGEYTLIRAGRAIRAAALWLAAAFLRGWNNVMEIAFPGARTVLRELFGPVYVFCRGLRNIWVHGTEVRRAHGFWAGIAADLQYLGRGAVRYAGLLPRMVVYLLPLASLAVLVAVVQMMVGRPYTLAVEVNGSTVGNVANETVFDAAREDVLQRVNYAGTTAGTELTIEPTYRLAITSDVMDESQMADAILSAVSDEISEGTALYLDGELTAVCAEGDQLQLYLSGLLEPYEDPEDPNVSVSFNRDVQVEQGLYFTDSFMDYTDVVSLLSGVRQAERVYTVVAGDSISLIATKNNLTTAELCELNGITTETAIFPGDELVVTREEAMLEVQITRTVTWTEEIPFSTKQTQSSDYSFGTTRTVQEGENGVRTITAQNLYATDGTLLNQTIDQRAGRPGDRGGHQAAQRQRGPGGQRHLHLAGAQLHLLFALVFQRPQGRRYLRPGRHPHLRLGQRRGHQGGLRAGRRRHRLRQLPHHRPWQRLQHPVQPLPVPDRQRRTGRQPGPADRLRRLDRALHRQPLPFRDPSQRPLSAAAKLFQ